MLSNGRGRALTGGNRTESKLWGLGRAGKVEVCGGVEKEAIRG